MPFTSPLPLCHPGFNPCNTLEFLLITCTPTVLLSYSSGNYHVHEKSRNWHWKIKWFAPSCLGSFKKHTWVMVWWDAIYLLIWVCSADLDILCSRLFSHLVKFYSFINPPSCGHFSHHDPSNFEAGDLICKEVSLNKRIGRQMATKQKL